MTYDQAVEIRTRQLQGLPVDAKQAEEAIRVIQASCGTVPQWRRSERRAFRLHFLAQQVAELLSPTTWLTRDDLATTLRVGGDSIKDAMDYLIRQGRPIEAVRGKGYRLGQVEQGAANLAQAMSVQDREA